MFNISSLLEKFSKNITSFEIDQHTLCSVIQEKTHIQLDPKQIEVKDTILYLRVSPAYKNKIFINKTSILEGIDVLFPKKITDIR